MQLQLKGLFAIDTFSLFLFAMSLLGALGHLPTITDIIVQSLFVGLTLLLMVSFMRRRLIGMLLLKIAMLFTLYFTHFIAYSI